MLNIFYEDQELIVVKKPVGMESQETHSFSPDLVSEIKKHIHHLSTKKEEPYVGVIHRLDKPVGGIMVYAKTKEAGKNMSRIVEKGISGAKRAELRYQVVDTFKEEELLTLVKIWLITGRHHQIRVQFAGRGLPLWGDHRYNSKFAGQKSIALSACELSFLHPKTKKPLTFQMEPEGEIFQRFFKL